MENTPEYLFEQIMLGASKRLEQLLVAWVEQYADSPMYAKSFDFLHENLGAVYEACGKAGMTLFLPKGLLEGEQSLGNLVDAMKEFWGSLKGRSLFELGREFFKEVVAEDFVFEEHLEDYVLDHSELEFGLLVFLLLTFMMVRRRGNQSALKEGGVFEGDVQGEAFLQKVVALLELLDAEWPDAQVPEAQSRRGTLVGGDLDLLRQIEKMKQELAELRAANHALQEKAAGVDGALADKDAVIEALRREKQDAAEAKVEMLHTIEKMKQEWLAEELKEKTGVIQAMEEDFRRRAEDFEDELRELSEALESKRQENTRLADELNKVGTGFSAVGFSVDAEEMKLLRSERDDLDQQLKQQNKNYMDLLERNTELDQRFREEETRRKAQEDELQDLRERLAFYTQKPTGGNQLASQPIDISNINQSEFDSLVGGEPR